MELPVQENNFNQIENSCGEFKDEQWGLKDLHTIRPNLSKISKDPVEIIGEENTKLYDKFNI